MNPKLMNSKPKNNIPTETDILAADSALSINDFLIGMSQLATIGVIETTDIVEAIHREIVLYPLGLLNHRYGKLWQKGISARVYATVKGITSLVGRSLALGFTQYSRLTRHIPKQPLPQRLTLVVNVINGVMGDHLVSQDNPLAQPMIFHVLDARHNTKPLYILDRSYLATNTNSTSNTPHQRCANSLSGRVIIMLHGLCMGHLNWQPDNEQALGSKILQKLPDVTVLYLSYNTGQRISTNGHQFAELMHRLVVHNPDITSIDLIGHSMGGLVSRSALFYGSKASYEWVNRVNKLITLGTPHHGALLERIGNFVQQSIAQLPFAGALAKLGDLRSAGIIDLRHGSIRDEDWQSLQSRSVLPDTERHMTPLLPHIKAYFLAGSLSEKGVNSMGSDLLGDGLVNINSALGEHTTEHTLAVPKERKAVFYGVGHLALLTDESVLDKTVEWLRLQ